MIFCQTYYKHTITPNIVNRIFMVKHRPLFKHIRNHDTLLANLRWPDTIMRTVWGSTMMRITQPLNLLLLMAAG